MAVQAAAAKPDFSRIWEPSNTALPGTPSTPAAKAPKPAEIAPHYPVPKASTPQAGKAPAKRETATAQVGGAPAKAGDLPVWVNTPPSQQAAQNKTDTPASAVTSVTVVQSDEPAADAAGVNGLLLSLSASGSTPAPGAGANASAGAALVEVGLDLAALDASTGGQFTVRGRLMSLPACALTTPEVPACLVRTPVATRYDAATKRVIADVTLPTASVSPSAPPPGAVKAALSDASLAAPAAAPAAVPMLLAAETGSSGGGGTYGATSLSASSGWAAGNSSGNMTYGYGVQVPPALGGPAPSVSLGYNSSAVDGKTSATNAQASWIGDGWDYNPGFIERTYKPCDKNGITGSGDLCWGGYNATLSLGSHSGPLVRAAEGPAASDDATGIWRLKGDDGTKVEFGTGAANGTDNGAYAKVTDSSGTVYYFGLNHLPGGDKSDPETKSASTVPVYAPNSGDRCYDAAKGKASWCQMWQRLSLDYVVDARGNLTTYTWEPEANFYSRGGGQNNGNGTLSSYTRATTLKRIDYGQLLDAQITAKGALQPAARVNFTVAERCLATGTACDTANRTVANKNNWPDVPVDQECKSTGTCTNYGPTYFTTKRLTTIATQVRVNNTWQDVDSYTLTHSFPDPSDTTSQKALWLDSVQRTGKTAAPNIAAPPVTFVPVMLPNRVDGTDLLPAPPLMNRPRIQQIKNEMGGVLNVDYNLRDCSRINNVMPTAEDDNTRACFPVRWSPSGSLPGADPVLDWFNHYTVASLTENDFATGSPAKITAYTYGPAAWHRDDSEFTDPKSRTWGDFRGFATVTVTTGDGNDGPKSKSTATYRQGMHGDARKAGGTRSVSLPDQLGNDVDWLAGQTLKTETFESAASAVVVSQTVNQSSGEQPTATHVRGSGLPDLVARYNATTSTTTSRARKSDGTWRTSTQTSTTDPDHGNRLLTALDQADGLPDQCTRPAYATGPDPQRTDLLAEKVTVSGPGACTATATAANTLSRTRMFYDSLPYGQAAKTANPTAQQVLDRYDGAGAPVFAPLSSAAFDTYGRVGSVTDVNSTDTQHPGGATTTTTYTSAAAGELPTTITLAAPIPGSATAATWNTVTILDTRRLLPLTVTDPNAKTVTVTYDALGRTTAVWSAGRTPASQANANQTFAYSVSNTTGTPSTVTTSSLTRDGSPPVYKRQMALLDGFGRTRQTQSSPAGPGDPGRMVTDTRYDSQGRARSQTAPWYTENAPSGTLLAAADSDIPAQTRTTFDGLSRPVTTALWSKGVQQSQTVTSYPGADRTDIVPPQGSWPTTTLTDGRGRTTEFWQYTTPATTGVATDAAVTRYTYTPAGQQATRVDAMGNTWSYGYDLRGRQTTATDPDTGTTTSTYDAASRVATTTDAKQQVLAYTYDLMGRKTGLYDGTVTGAKQLAAWTFDTVAKGKPTSSTRYVGGITGQTYTTTVTGYDDAYRTTGSTVTIPGTEVGQAAGTTYTYTAGATYDQATGNLKEVSKPALGGLPYEEIGYSYNGYGQLISYGGATTYDAQTAYDAFGRPIRSTINPWASQVVTTTDYDQATGRVRSLFLDKQTSTTGVVQQTSYTYNPSGTITSITDVPDNNPAATSRQCFTYDALGRMTTAWTDTGTITTPDPLQHKTLDQGACTNTTPTSGAIAPSKTTVGGANAYWQDYTYDLTGNRKTLTQHDPAGDTTKDITTTQTFGAPGTVNTPTQPLTSGGGTGGPHALLTAKTTGSVGTNEYDATGNTTKIANPKNSRTLKAGYVIKSGENVRSNSVQLAMQADGNLVLTSLRTGNVLWSSNTANHPGAKATMRDDGNFVVYDTAQNVLWSSNTAIGAGSGYFAAVQDDGLFLVYAPGYQSKWSSSTWNAIDAAAGATLTWNTEGKLASTTQGTATTTYLYDADGNQLIRRNPGKTTLNLGGDELVYDTNAKTFIGTRYYPIPGGLTIVRTGAGTAPGAFVAQLADHHGTDTASIDLSTLAVTRRPTDPFGNPRDTLPKASAWAGNQGFIDGTKDNTTGLTNLGARQYQPTTGRFISPDPILDPADPQQWNGYAYSNNNPINFSDPSGLKLQCGGGSAPSCPKDNTLGGQGVGDVDPTMEYKPKTKTGLEKASSAIGGFFRDAGKAFADKAVDTVSGAFDFASKYISDGYHCIGGSWGSCLDTAKTLIVSNPTSPFFAVNMGIGIFSDAAEIYDGYSNGHAGEATGQLGFFLLQFAGGGEAAELRAGLRAGKGASAIDRFLDFAGKCKAPNSFPAGTLVLLADGTTKEIDQLTTDDEVLATDPQTGITQPERILDTIIATHDQEFTDLTIETGGRDQNITSTQHHPYWNATTQRWTDAADLQPGESLRKPDGTLTKIISVRNYRTPPTSAYNLTIDQLHTYYVLAGGVPILVHNSGDNPWDNAHEWTKGHLPKEGGPANGVFFKRYPDAGGSLTAWGVYDENGRLRYRVDLFGAAHRGVETPHWQTYEVNPAPSGKIFVNETGDAFPGDGPFGGPPTGCIL
ncbi:polymorphic toxin type 24 domain-containing protein [Kitasatospora sp. NPDC002040]|uniref:polymorphic toxin type 24 domain-containing protein n=1 Tax=Kitasatospora sp. NPDC002040 TaxID=3154661 RepID=UPI00331A2434